jgi:hypothetical protein
MLEALTKNHLLVTHRAVLAALHPVINTSQVKMMPTSSGYLGILLIVTCSNKNSIIKIPTLLELILSFYLKSI